MGKLHACLLISVGALAACGSDSKGTVDAPVVKVPDAPADAGIDAPPDGASYDFSCMSATLPTTAADPITLAGTVQELSINGAQPSVGALDGANVAACIGNCVGTNHLANVAMSGPQGAFSMASVPTGGTPVDGYVKMSKAGDRTTLVFPPDPFVANLAGIPMLTFTDTPNGGAFAFITGLAGVTQDAGKGVMTLEITDCANKPIADSANVTLVVKQGGTDVAGTTVFDLGSLQPQAAGTYFVFNVPANTTTQVGVTYMMGSTPVTFRAHNVRVESAATTATIVRPGV